MIIIEEDAADFACCAARERDGSCVGSLCAAWRWARVRNPDWKPVDIDMHEAHPDDWPKPYIKSETYGYCGLAGVP